MTRRHLHVVAAVIEREGEILASLRHPKGERPGQWEFPGGKVERGETESQALEREMLEELGVECEVGALVHRLVHRYQDADVEIAFYEVRLAPAAQPQALGMAEIRWVPRARLGELDFLEADRPFVRLLAEER